tara:strand:+ start:297 stop:1334 length:1038 start_codon:yes stop_codon:yes gene_type:complete
MKNIISNIFDDKQNTSLIVSEIGINHFGSLSLAKKIVDEIVKNGGKAVKVQIHIPDEEMSEEAKYIAPGNSNKNIYDIIKKNSLSLKDELKLKDYIDSKGLLYIATPFSYAAAKWLNEVGIKIFKIGSGECNNLPLVDYITSFKKPIILSTGMNSLSQVKKSVTLINKKKIKNVILHCVNRYPTSTEKSNLSRINELKKSFKNSSIGYSDHTIGINAAKIAITMGAKVIEKHFTLNNKLKGPDISCSMNGKDLSELLKFSLEYGKIIKNKKREKNYEQVTARFAFHSVVSRTNISKGEKFSKKNLTTKRPGIGDFHANEIYSLFGKIAKKNIKRNILLKKRYVKN